ncbi:MAG: DUF2953 domain-containing protein [Oscillospiraceae bacterium]|nr:DUF2953 domain-containing protein [Oscillospiraceae bacterium]
MVGTILLIILFILCVLLLLPVRAKASYGDGKWSVAVYYAFIRLFHKESKEKPQPELPKKPEDLPEGEAPPVPETDAAQTAEKPKPQPEPVGAPPEQETETPEPEAEAEDFSEPLDPEQLADTVETPEIKPEKKRRKRKAKKEESAAEVADPDDLPDLDAEPEPEKKPRGIRGFIERLKPHSVSDVLGLAEDGFAALTPALRFLTKHIHFRHIRLYLAIGTDDPANTATLYGKICAAAYNLLGAMQCWFDVEADEFRILADFYNDKITFRGAAEVRISPMAAIILVLILGCKFLWRTVCRFRREDKEAKLREKESSPLPQA